MRPKISKKNLAYYLRQNYSYSSIDAFFKIGEKIPKHRNKVIQRIVTTFTGYHLENGKLLCFNPYTNKNEALKIKNFDHVQSKEDLLKELSMLHKMRMRMLEQSRKRILQLSKKKVLKRDHDLEATITKTKEPKRLQQLQKGRGEPEKELEQEQGQ